MFPEVFSSFSSANKLLLNEKELQTLMKIATGYEMKLESTMARNSGSSFVSSLSNHLEV